MDRKKYDEIISKCREISISKNKDYGDKPLERFGTYGILVRLYDKLERAINLIESNQEPNNEKLEDTFLDMTNYSIYALMFLYRKQAKKTEPENDKLTS